MLSPLRKVKEYRERSALMEYHLTTPIPPEELKKIKIGDVVYITGTIVTARDEAHLKALELHKEGKQPPTSIEQPATRNKQLATSNQQPATSNQQRATNFYHATQT